MKVALIGDAHGNLHALEAVLREIRRRRVDAIWNLGDAVGYGPFPEEVVVRLRQAGALSIAGNFDLRVLDADPRDPEAGRTSVDKWIAPVWAHENLSPSSLRYLASLPRERRLFAEGRKILLIHGSPASNTERLEPTASPDRLAELATMARAELVLFGHSHIPFVRQADGVTFVNPGGVGRSDDGDPRASYAVLDARKGGVRVTHHRVTYDLRAAVDALMRRGLPESFGRMLWKARPLDVVQQDPNGHLPGSSAAHVRYLEEVLELARRSRYEVGHTHQVTRLALDLFDQLRRLHRLGPSARRWLLYASLLHDIGWMEGGKGHHKVSQRVIESSRDLSFPLRMRKIVASIARYHKGALPKVTHHPYAELSPADRGSVTRLSAILRVADGLDRTHRSVVRRISVKVFPGRVRVRCAVRAAAEEERESALRKGDLFTQTFHRELSISCSRR
jgi:putative phosphoesterase